MIRESFRLDPYAGVVRRPRDRRQSGPPVEVVTVHPDLWPRVWQAADGIPGRIEVRSETEVVVHNHENWSGR